MFPIPTTASPIPLSAEFRPFSTPDPQPSHSTCGLASTHTALASSSLPAPKSSDNTFRHIPIPAHWTATLNSGEPSFCTSAFTVLCMLAYGHTTLMHWWTATCSGDEVLARDNEQIISRLTITSVVAGLLLSSTAALITTEPPRADLLDYTQRGPYLLLWASFGMTLGGMILSSTNIYALSTYNCVWFRTVIMSTRARVWCTLVLFAYPSFAVGIGAALCVAGILISAWTSQDMLVVALSFPLLILPVSMSIVYWSTVREPVGGRKDPLHDIRQCQDSVLS
ncbi:uncharacterized protein BXZ73DRAFT_61875 [Epithele typhae]|uniref:uncharacterized protein n=1 Tax=Epithele typhae TaxID=378194 RepID=UPI0020087510|nr:uncharacterized protein BXZ73DRAFT_61875 [Epithele typhae]KAH9904643.1 hypothetical protein BXZ73DRAFT_61875 [Epithele typhae]